MPWRLTINRRIRPSRTDDQGDAVESVWEVGVFSGDLMPQKPPKGGFCSGLLDKGWRFAKLALQACGH